MEEQDFTKQHSDDADIVMNFVSDTSIWKKHSHMMDRFFDGLPGPEHGMKQKLNFLFKDDSTISLDAEVLYFLKNVAKEYDLKTSKFTDRFFKAVSTDQFEIEFLNKICNAKKLKDVTDWIKEVKQSGYAYQDTTSISVCKSK